jgi:hypothetical protein
MLTLTLTSHISQPEIGTQTLQIHIGRMAYRKDALGNTENGPQRVGTECPSKLIH